MQLSQEKTHVGSCLRKLEGASADERSVKPALATPPNASPASTPLTRDAPVPNGFLWNLAAVWATVILWRLSPLHAAALDAVGHSTLLAVAVGYTILGGFTAFTRPDNQPSRAQLGAAAFAKWLRGERPDEAEAVSARFLLVKVCFVPLMLNFCVLHSFRAVGSLVNWITQAPVEGLVHGGWFEQYGYSFAIAVLFLVDTAYFSFGYLIEDERLGNKVRSVEPTFFGWFIALMCYPPFNNWTTQLLEWHSDHTSLDSYWLSVALHIGEIVLLAVYTWASVALGTKCSNLTNRGTIARGPYAVVRHPAYVSKVTAWWLMAVPVMSPVVAASVSAWTMVYVFRALTEERHLEADPDYRAYQSRVRWRFIPGVV